MSSKQFKWVSNSASAAELQGQSTGLATVCFAVLLFVCLFFKWILRHLCSPSHMRCKEAVWGNAATPHDKFSGQEEISPWEYPRILSSASRELYQGASLVCLLQWHLFTCSRLLLESRASARQHYSLDPSLSDAPAFSAYFNFPWGYETEAQLKHKILRLVSLFRALSEFWSSFSPQLAGVQLA